MGRHKIEVNQEQLEALLRLNPTLKDTSAFFKVSEDTIERRCKDFGYADFADARVKNLVHTRLGLIRKAVTMADQGSIPMLIFSLKNMCGWTDKVETTHDMTDAVKQGLSLKYSIEDKD